MNMTFVESTAKSAPFATERLVERVVRVPSIVSGKGMRHGGQGGDQSEETRDWFNPLPSGVHTQTHAVRQLSTYY